MLNKPRCFNYAKFNYAKSSASFKKVLTPPLNNRYFCTTNNDNSGTTKPFKERNCTTTASSRDAWLNAPTPPYGSSQYQSIDRRYFYSELPVLKDLASKYGVYKLTSREIGENDILDFWGEGRVVDGITTGFRSAYNINHQYQLISNGTNGVKGHRIPNRVPVNDYFNLDSLRDYIDDGIFSKITVMGAPINEATAGEISRIIKPNGIVVLYGFEEDEYLIPLQSALKKKDFILHPQYKLPNELAEVTLKPILVFTNVSSIKDDVKNAINSNDFAKVSRCLESLYKEGYKDLVKDAIRESINSTKIFKIGFNLRKTAIGKALLRDHSIISQNISDIILYSETRIFEVKLDHGAQNRLCSNGDVGYDSWRDAYFASSERWEFNTYFQIKILPQNEGEYFYLSLNHGVENRLCSNGDIGNDSWEWAHFNSFQRSEYHNYSRIKILPQNEGEYFYLSLNHGVENRLCSNGDIGNNSWEWAHFNSFQRSEYHNYSRIKIWMMK